MKTKNAVLFLVILLALVAIALPAAGPVSAAPKGVASISATPDRVCPTVFCLPSIDGTGCKCRSFQPPIPKPTVD